MVVWCIVLILLGLWGLVQDILALDVPAFLSPLSNVAIMLVALGLLVRIRSKAKERALETLEKRVAELEGATG